MTTASDDPVPPALSREERCEKEQNPVTQDRRFEYNLVPRPARSGKWVDVRGSAGRLFKVCGFWGAGQRAADLKGRSGPPTLIEETHETNSETASGRTES